VNFCALATFQRLICECVKILRTIAKNVLVGNIWLATSPTGREGVNDFLYLHMVEPGFKNFSAT